MLFRSVLTALVVVSGMMLAGVLALSALPISAMSVGAEGAYAPGDVDMDGVITGHDAAVVSRYLHVDNTLLNADQLALADVNGDGVVDQADADWIHENEAVELGACDISVPNPTSLFYQLVISQILVLEITLQLQMKMYPLSRFLTLKFLRKTLTCWM